ncbi:hypothetical protein GGR51DRAFT_498963 [Nemania sp. FL0031]|nr:hypothetical protein GGR51DRAFT_498963 [Nemania sp. FL0031]
MTGAKEPKITTSFISHLRQASKVTCTIVGCGDKFPNTDDRIREHLESKHSDYIIGQDLNAIIRDIKGRRTPNSQVVEQAGPAQSPLSTRDPGGGSSKMQWVPDDAGFRSSKKPKSPEANRAQSTSPPRRSRARAQPNDPDFIRNNPRPGELWDPNRDPNRGSPSALHKTKPSSFKPSNPTTISRAVGPSEEEDSEVHRLIKQPETRPISQEQLVAEVKGIYAGLMMVESKCIEVDNAQSSQSETKLNNEQWQALIALHRTLLHEHHDFFLASQHPSANQALRRLASKYAMPARMWRHGIHSFLELLRHRLPQSLEHMLTFIYLAYSMMALLYETVPAFEDTWIECLGDLGRYRMAIEDEDIRDREVWTSVSRHWYSKASDKAPTTGRLYHHLAILARPNALQQLFYYVKSLCVPVPFASTKESIMTLFDPILGVGGYQHARLNRMDVAFVKAHGILFSRKQANNFLTVVKEFLKELNDHIGKTKEMWKEAGYYIAIANCCGILSYGNVDSVIMGLVRIQIAEDQGQTVVPPAAPLKRTKEFEDALHLAMGTHEVVFRRWDDANVLPYTHVVMVFMLYLTRLPGALQHIEHQFPWKLLSAMLNRLLPDQSSDKIRSDKFPREGANTPHPLPEDFAMKGLVFEREYYPADWFSSHKVDDDEKYLEMASMTNVRKERILWIGHKIAQSGRGLTFDEKENIFGVFAEFDEEMEDISEDIDDMDISDASNAGSQTPGRGEDEMDVDDSSVSTPIVRML